MMLSLAAAPAAYRLSSIRRDPRKFAEKLGIRDLVSVLKYLDERYEEQNNSPVADEVYDIMVDVLRERKPNHKFLSKTGVKVVDRKDKVKLPARMPSLDKLKPGTRKLYNWLDGFSGPFCLSDKLDGISLEIVYEKGVPTKAYTRGNGTVGKDRSGILPSLRIPRRISVRNTFIVRAEVLIRQSKFMETYHKSVGGEFTTGRNMGGGLINRNEPNADLKQFRVVTFEILKGPGHDQKQSSQLKKLKTLGFTIVQHKTMKRIDEAVLSTYHDRRKKASSVELDGIVVFRDVPYVRPKSGLPTYGMAFKKNSLEATQIVKITEIEWRVSRYGKVIPRVHIDPIILGGVSVRHFTGHNAFYIMHGYKKEDRKPGFKSKPLGVGAEIRVIRSGDVIPYIMEVVKPARKASVPDFPVVLDGVHYVVDKGHGADEIKAKSLMQFFNALEIEGVQRGNVDKMVGAGYSEIPDIVQMEVSDFLEIDGFKEKTAQKLYDNLQKGLASVDFPRLALASNLFQNFGQSRLEAIGAKYPDIMDRKWTDSELETAVSSIRGFKKMASDFVPAFKTFKKWVRASKIKVQKVRVHKPSGNKMAGQTVGFSGVRDKQLMDWIKEQGGQVSNGVTMATTILVMKETGTGSSKEQKAQDRGLPILTVDEFKRKYL